MVKQTIKYSVLCGVFLIAIFFISINFGSNPLLDIRHFLFDLALFFLFVFFACKEYKDFRNDGILHFWEGISIGFVVFIPAVLIFCLAFFVIFETNEQLMIAYKEGAKAFLLERKEVFLEEFSKDQLNDQMRSIDSVTVSQLLFSTFGKKIFAGFLVTPIVSIILRKKPK